MKKNKIIYQEFGDSSKEEALQKTKPDLPPEQQNVRIQSSRSGRKGKTVTVISGFKTSTSNLSLLLKDLKTKCGTGGTLKDDTIEIQGDHKQKILEILLKLGYKAKISGG